MAEYVPTIGLEIHAELKTRSKMFCRSKNDPFEAEPNVNICPVCMAHPGTLPVINGEAVKHVLKVGVALGGKLADYTEFDRKNYFYPDLPKGYQLSQYEFPLVSGGSLNNVAITRVHLEEDTASSMHREGGEGEGGATLIDYNRAGVPLMELVTEPVLRSAKDAGDFGRELQILLRTLGVSDADMEKGHMRLEANISVSNSGQLGTKVEVKNINSFGIMERAIEHEIKRQIGILEKGETIVQETRGWDEKKQATFPQRVKEGSADYRYFPDPDLPSLKLSEVREYARDALTKDMPELPWERRARYVALGLKESDAAQLVRDADLGVFFEEVGKILKLPEKVRLAANYIVNDLVSLRAKRDMGAVATATAERPAMHTRDSDFIGISAENFAKLMEMLAGRKVSSRAGKDILAKVFDTGKDPESIAKEEGLLQKSADIEGTVQSVVMANPSVVEDFKAGKAAALEYLVGQGMKALRGAADPVELREAIRKAME